MKNSSTFRFYSLLLLVLFSFFKGYSQNKVFELSFKLRDEAVNPLSDVSVEVYLKNENKLIATYKTPESGNTPLFKVDLFHEYILVFSKNGFATKKMWIDANVKGKESKTNLYYNHQILVYLYTPSSKMAKAELLDKPSQKFIYDSDKDDFVPDADYEAAIKNEVIKSDVQGKPVASPSSDPTKNRIISGKLYSGGSTSTPLVNTTVDLIDETGNIVETAITNQFGKFVFRKSIAGKNYKMHIGQQDKTKKIPLLTVWLDEVGVMSADEKGNFNFELLSSDKKTISMLTVDDDKLAISGNLLALLNGTNKPLANKKLSLVNDKGEVVDKATTNEFGTFAFSKFSAENSFSVRIDENDSQLPGNSKIVMTNRNGNEISSTTAGDQGKFSFTFSATDKTARNLLAIDDTQLKIDISGFLLAGANKAPYANKKIGIVDETGKTLQSVTTDAKGRFAFNRLNADQKHLITLEDADAALLSKFYIADEQGKVVKECSLDKNDKGFRFRLLPSDQKQLGTVYVDDPWLNLLQLKSKAVNANGKGLVITERVYFNFNESVILPEAQKVLDKVAQVMNSNPNLKIEVAAHTDTKGTDEYNMDLSKKRAQNALNYLVSKAIAVNRLKSVGYGETQPIIKCPTDAGCSEEEHSQNRRIEFKVEIAK
jgi:outer membrane protein OmpA-like peptidoglycan-associated protein